MGRRATAAKRQVSRKGTGKAAIAGRRGGDHIGCRGLLGILLTTLAIGLVGTLCLGIPTIVGAYGYFLKELPSPENVGSQDTFKTARILDRQGRLLYEIIDPHGGRRTVVPLADIATPMQWATIAVEDASFYVNPGFDIRSIARALWLNVRGSQVVSGGSTITQQLVKNTLLTPEVSFQRKLKEAVLAWEASRRYSKDQILEMYLNEVYYGNMAYGVEAAAQTYFGKAAKDLGLAEAALLAGLVQSPAEYDPFGDLPAAKERQGIVLDLMAKYALITPDEAEAAKRGRLALRRRSEATAVPLKAPHFAMFVRDLVERSYGRDLLYHGGLEIRTTLDLDVQQAAEEVIREHLAKIKKLNANSAALVAIDPATGEILAMVGSADYFDDASDGQVNVALSRRQPGSTLKPFIYLTAFAKGYTAASILQDVATTFPGGYRPLNHDKKFRGPVRVREALANSLNVPAVQMLRAVGMGDALATMHRMGITDLGDERRYGLTLALGGGEVKLLDLTFAYAPLANGGRQVGDPVAVGQRKAGYREYAPVAVRRVVDGSGRLIYEYRPPEGKQVVDPQLSYLITSILSDDAARAGTYGRHSFLELARPAAAKTGTTDDFRDGWTVGYTPDLVAGVWVGNADNSAMLDVYGISGAGYIWHKFMERVLEGRPARGFPRPPGIQEVKICADTGQPATASCPQPMTEVFASNVATLPVVVSSVVLADGTRAAIAAPGQGAAIYGMVDVIGSAVAPGTTSYALEYVPAATPEKWTAIVANRPFSVEDNLLGRWDTSGIAAGPYMLRLRVSNGRGAVQTVLVRVTVAPPGAAFTAATATSMPSPSATSKPPQRGPPVATPTRGPNR